MCKLEAAPPAPRRVALDSRPDFAKIVAVGSLYTTIAGMLNGLAVYELGTPVGYTSGPCVNAGRFLATGDKKAKHILGVCSLFYLGGIMAGLGGSACDGDYIFEGRASPGVLLSASMLALGTYMKQALRRPTLCMQTWALSQGLLNGITSSFSAVPLRATHTAGGQTDAGLTVARAILTLCHGQVPPSMRRVVLNAACCIGMILGGWLVSGSESRGSAPSLFSWVTGLVGSLARSAHPLGARISSP